MSAQTRRLAIVAVIWSVVWLGAFAVWSAQAKPGRAPTSGVAPETFSTTVGPGGQACFASQLVPASAGTIQMTLGTLGKPVWAKVEVTGTSGGKRLFSGSTTFREAQDVNVPVSPVAAESSQVDLCVKNAGMHPFQIGGKPGVGVSFRYPSAMAPTWMASTGDLADRFQYGRFNPFGWATLWFALGLGLVSACGGVIVVVRSAR